MLLQFKLAIPVLFISFTVMGPPSYGGVSDGAGGDSCEERFKVISRDLKTWIQQGGALGMTFQEMQNLSAERYTFAMLEQIDKARITCVAPGDEGYPVLVNGKAKECKNTVDAKGVTRIICDRNKFYSDRPNPGNDSSQYMLVHHEYASLAGLEIANQDDSNYQLSDQITNFLEQQIVTKLVVKSIGPTDAQGAFENELEQEKQLQRIARIVQKTQLQSQAMARFLKANNIDLRSASWKVLSDVKPENWTRAKAIETKETYVYDSYHNACRVHLNSYDTYAKRTVIGLYDYGAKAPYAGDDTYAFRNIAGRIYVIDTYCIKNGTHQSYSLHESQSDIGAFVEDRDATWIRSYLQVVARQRE